MRGGAFSQLLNDIRACKEQGTCSQLTIRSLYFEPNPVTAARWRVQSRFVGPIDRRVMFICESPGPWPGAGESTDPVVCWGDDGFRSRRFRDVLSQFGFADCYITNSVKCGPRRGRCHTSQELSACAPFLLRELALIAPLVAVAVGGNAKWALDQLAANKAQRVPPIHEMTHYSAHFALAKLQERWASEFGKLNELLSTFTDADG